MSVMSARRVQGTFDVLTFGNTIAASFIWGINTLFLLDTGLSNLEAFAANAFFTLGMVIFEIPTGVVADTWGRRASYLLGTITLGVPFLVRVGVLLAMVVVAGSLMRDLGFTPVRGAGPVTAVRTVMRASIDHGFRRPAIRWVMVATPFTAGVGIYAFYALQPYLLEVAGDSTAYALAGIAAAIFAGSSIIGGALAPVVRRAVRRRTTVLIASVAVSSAVLVAFSFVNQLWLAIVLLAAWGLTTSVAQPAQRSYLNDMIPSAQRATVLSFHSLLGGVISACALPFLALSRAQRDPADEATTLVATE